MYPSPFKSKPQLRSRALTMLAIWKRKGIRFTERQ